MGVKKDSSQAIYPGASHAQILARLGHKNLLIVTADTKEALRWQTDLSFFYPNEDIALYPPPDTLPYYQLSSNPDLSRKRLGLLARLTLLQSPVKMIVPLQGLIKRLMPRQTFVDRSLSIRVGEKINREDLVKKLAALAYERVPLVEDTGTFAVRGGVMDLFSPAHDHPCRIELFDDQVESLRFFDIDTQKTLLQANDCLVVPARELLIDVLPKNWTSLLKKQADTEDVPKPERDRVQENLENGIYSNGIESFIKLFYDKPGSLFDYLSPDTVIFPTHHSFGDRISSFLEERQAQRETSNSPERLFAPKDIYLTANEYKESLEFFNIPTISATIETNITSTHALQARKGPDLMDELARQINERLASDASIFIVTASQSQCERIADLLKRHDIPSEIAQNSSLLVSQALDLKPMPGVHILKGPLSGGYYFPESRQWWITDEEIFGQKTHKQTHKPKGEAFSSFSQLKSGDFVVHQSHGVALFKGLINLQIANVPHDFLLLEYLGGDKLYVPVDQIGLIYHYTAQEGMHPMLDKMGTASWAKTRDRVKRATRRLARELLDIQAKRQAARGFAFSAANETFEEFEAAFPFDETEDQLKAIQDVLQDMESDRPMDRLVCGDVGYGKTEVAMRAAFKAVLDHKQVAVLVPTTVLALQHFENFKKRLEKHAVTIAIMSRFQSAKEQKETIEKLKNGSVDIVIGTHRILSKDVDFRDLGLLIVDEEHRFGVAQKEKIKKFQNLIDILTLTATPIPRTLNFALVGIRDLSVINTPPADRLAVRTYVTHFDEKVLKEAIEHETKRGGQVFFVHNRVQSLPMICDRIKRIAPKISIGMGHGQMPEENLENVMLDFMHRKFDLLLSTTIIESGLDIPTANTIIIDRADTFGLAQLYQLRGRVGRSHHRAYCYLLTPQDKAMTDDARKRLDVIQRFTELGSGFKIAAHDLEIRGAGNILGQEQSGHITLIGYDLYVKLLEEAVEALKSGSEFEEIITEVKLPISTLIPESLVPDPQLRLSLYKQLSAVKNDAGFDSIYDEWTDRLGNLPDPTNNLIRLMRLKSFAQNLKIVSLSYQKESLVMEVNASCPIPTDVFLGLVKKSPSKHQFLRDGRFMTKMTHSNDKHLLESITKLLLEMRETKTL